MLTSLLVFLTLCLTPGESKPQDGFLWKNRVILLSAENIEDAKLIHQLEELSRQWPALLDRDIVVIIKTDSIFQYEPNSFHLIRDTKLNFSILDQKDPYQITLIGKDGFIKLQENGNIGLQQLFSVIDNTPLRMREVRFKAMESH